MLKKYLSIAIIVLLIKLACFSSGMASTNPEKEMHLAEKVKAGIARLGTGTEARVELKLKNKTKLKGYVSEANAENFTVIDANGIATEFTYPNVKQVKGNNLSKNVILTLVVVGTLAVALISAVIFSGN